MDIFSKCGGNMERMEGLERKECVLGGVRDFNISEHET
jgi:hypothetical protein